MEKIFKAALALTCPICGAAPGTDCDRTEFHYMVDRNSSEFLYWQYSVVVDGATISPISGEAAEEVARAKAEKDGGVVVRRAIVAEGWEII